MSTSLTTNVLKHHLVIFFGEFTGTAFLMYFGCLSINVSHVNITEAALAWGFIVTAIIMIFGHITRGHFNPCVTLCSLILGLITPLTGLVYVAAEMLGAITGFYVVNVSLPKRMVVNGTNPDTFCLTTFHDDISITQGMLCEFIATSLLIYAVCSAWDPRNAIWSDSVALKFGWVVAICTISIGPYTAASLNPARSFAPALIHNMWRHHWAYWVATFGGSICTTLIYKYLYLADADEELKAREKLSDVFKQGSLHAKADRENIIPTPKANKTAAVSPETDKAEDRSSA